MSEYVVALSGFPDSDTRFRGESVTWLMPFDRQMDYVFDISD